MIPEFTSEAALNKHYAEVRARLRPALGKRRLLRPVPLQLPAPLAEPEPGEAPPPQRDWLVLGQGLPVVIDPEIPDDPFMPRWKRIAIEVAVKHKIRLNELRSARRSHPFVIARQEAFWRIRNETSLSFPAIGKHFGGRDHTTVLYGIRRHEQKMKDGAA